MQSVVKDPVDGCKGKRPSQIQERKRFPHRVNRPRWRKTLVESHPIPVLIHSMRLKRKQNFTVRFERVIVESELQVEDTFVEDVAASNALKVLSTGLRTGEAEMLRTFIDTTNFDGR